MYNDTCKRFSRAHLHHLTAANTSEQSEARRDLFDVESNFASEHEIGDNHIYIALVCSYSKEEHENLIM